MTLFNVAIRNADIQFEEYNTIHRFNESPYYYINILKQKLKYHHVLHRYYILMKAYRRGYF